MPEARFDDITVATFQICTGLVLGLVLKRVLTIDDVRELLGGHTVFSVSTGGGRGAGALAVLPQRTPIGSIAR